MGPVLFGGADRYDQRWALEQSLAHRTGSHLFQTPGTGTRILMHRGRRWLVIVVAAGIVAAEWLRHPSLTAVLLEWACLVAGIGLLQPWREPRRYPVAVLLAAIALTMTASQRSVMVIETRWPEERERRINAASEHLDRIDLPSTLERADRLARAAAAIPFDDRAAAFHVLHRLMPRVGADLIVVVFD